jgi:DNA-binding transcriptional ArsR family regulator
VELLGARERSVQELADLLPISRPAVSRHLRLLKRAGLVVERPRGTRRIYTLHDQGIEAVRSYVERVWGDASARYRAAVDDGGGAGPERHAAGRVPDATRDDR